MLAVILFTQKLMRNINSPQLAKSFVSKHISSFLLCCSKIRNISNCTSPKGLLCTYFCNGASLGHYKCSSGYYFAREKHVPLVSASFIALGAAPFNPNSFKTNVHLKKCSFSTSFEMKIENDVVRFSLDNHNCEGKQMRRKKKIKRSSRSKKSIVDELRFYRLKAKKKMNSPNPEVRIRYKLDKAKRKEVWLIEKLRAYEGPKSPVETHDPEILTEEERFYLKRTGEKRKNYVPVGRRGVFGGVVLNMHLHWKKHETVKVYFNPCKPGQIHEYAQELTRLSKGIVIDIKPDNSIIFYRGKNYVQPEIMSPPSLSKYKALEKYKLEQSLEHTSLFIEKLEKELSDYHLHLLHFKNKPPPSLVPDHTKLYR